MAFEGLQMFGHMLPEILPEVLHAAPEGLSTVIHAAPEVVLHAEPAVSAALHAEPAINAAVHSAAPEAGVIADGTVTARSGAAKVINYNGVAHPRGVVNIFERGKSGYRGPFRGCL